MEGRIWAGLAMAMVLGLGTRAVAQNDAGPTLAQPQTAQATGYPVTGRVICADTQRAARFATVSLIAAGQEGFGGRRLFTRTDLDGNFTLVNVPGGDYYVTGALTGYINSSTQVQSALTAGTDPAASVPGVSLVHVSAGGASAAISLQRGSVVAGSVQWDDGSPAAGVSVTAQAVPSSTGGAATGSAQLSRGFGTGFGGTFGGFNGTQTDDRGRFRLTGLAPGPYYVRATIQAAAPQSPTDRGNGRVLNFGIYAPNKVRRTEAAVITLAGGEERADVNIVLGLAAMHTVSGVVSSAGAAVRSGTVNLSDQTDSTLSRTGSINPDGSFTVAYVPSGTYTLRVTASSQAGGFGRGGTQGSDPATRFQPLQESLTVADSDLTGVNLTVTVATSAP